ncbi:12622_t:CDS:1, partial [Rhizophagus irregularis]
TRHKNKVQRKECSCGRNHLRIAGRRKIKWKFDKDRKFSYTESARISDIAKLGKYMRIMRIN